MVYATLTPRGKAGRDNEFTPSSALPPDTLPSFDTTPNAVGTKFSLSAALISRNSGQSATVSRNVYGARTITLAGCTDDGSPTTQKARIAANSGRAADLRIMHVGVEGGVVERAAPHNRGEHRHMP